MRKFFGILFIILGIVCLPSVFAPSAAETIGRVIGWSITSVFPAYFLLRNTSKQEDNQEK